MSGEYSLAAKISEGGDAQQIVNEVVVLEDVSYDRNVFNAENPLTYSG